MIKLAFAIGFLAVFGVIATILIIAALSYFKPKPNTKEKESK